MPKAAAALAGAETSPTEPEAFPWADKRWEGHAHKWPKAKRGALIRCRECDMPEVYEPRDHE